MINHLRKREEKVIVVICEKCGYEWEPKRKGVRPKSCPLCKRYLDWCKQKR